MPRNRPCMHVTYAYVVWYQALDSISTRQRVESMLALFSLHVRLALWCIKGISGKNMLMSKRWKRENQQQQQSLVAHADRKHEPTQCVCHSIETKRMWKRFKVWCICIYYCIIYHEMYTHSGWAPHKFQNWIKRMRVELKRRQEHTARKTKARLNVKTLKIATMKCISKKVHQKRRQRKKAADEKSVHECCVHAINHLQFCVTFAHCSHSTS